MQFYLRNDYTPKTVRYNYPINNFSGLDALSEQNTLPLTYCSYGYNIGFRNGALINGMGIEYARINNSLLPNVGAMGRRIMKSWIYLKYNYTIHERQDKIVALLDNGAVYTTPLDGGTSFTQTTMSFAAGMASALNYHYNGEDVFLLFGSQGGMYLYDGTNATFYQDVPGFNSVCMHYDRVYGTTETGLNRVYFSDDLDPTNWQTSLSEGGYLSFPDEGGRVQKVLSFNDYVFIFRENGIHRLTAYTDLTEYKLTKVFSTSNKVYPNTVQICGDKILFLAEDGLYSFDGFTARKFFSQLFPIIAEKKYSVACYFNYKYYLATNITKPYGQVVGDESEIAMKNNCIIAIDFDLNNVSILRGADICSFLPVNMGDICQLIVSFNNFRSSYLGMINASGKLINTPLKKIWVSPKTNLSKLEGDKIIRRIYISAKQPLTITVDAEEQVIKTVYSSPNIQMIPINKKVEDISIKLETESDELYLNGLLLEFDLIRRRYING